MARRLYIFGAQNFAEMCHYFFSEDSGYEVAGFTVDAEYLVDTSFCGLPVIAYEELRKTVPPADADIFVAIGVARINTVRAERVARVRADGYTLASVLSTRAHVHRNLVLRPNTMVMDHVMIHPGVTIGANAVLWSNCGIALKARIGDHAWITSAVIGDSSTIGDYSFIGLNATIAPFVNVGSHNLIGAGAVITRDTKDYQVFRGPRSMPSAVSSLRVRNLSLIH